MPSFESNEIRYNLKQESWKRTGEEVDRIVDKLERPVDPGIKESVVALRVLGFTTDGSCEGHIDRGLKGPWIDIGQIPREIRDRVRNARRTADGHFVDPEIAKLYQETSMELLRERARLIELLDEFYRGRNVPYEKRLILKCHDDSRLISQGADARVLDLNSPDIQRRKFKEFREEMAAFTDFLKDKFFSSN